MFSIVIPTWNNFPYLRLCIESILKNSKHKHQIIVHVNDGSDGTLEYLQAEGIDYTHSSSNIGICYAVNKASLSVKGDYVVYMNDDMYVCPDWDTFILEEINNLPDDNFMLSGTLIEPRYTNNPCVIHHNYGTDLASFDENNLIAHFRSHDKEDWCGSTWPPTVVSKNMWHLVGGYSIEFSPGMSSDDDFSMKMWHAGCRVFKGIAKSRIYHFQAKSTGRIQRNNGRKQFLHKWGINQSTFNKHYIKKGSTYQGALSAPPAGILKKEMQRARLKTIWYNIKEKLQLPS